MSLNFSALQSSGLSNFLLPLLLVTAMTYSVLQFAKTKSKSDGKDFIFNDTAIALISIIVGFFAANNSNLQKFLNHWMPYFIIFVILSFLYLFIMKVFNKDEKSGGSDKKDAASMVVLLMLIMTIISTYGIDNFSRYLGSNTENIIWGITFVIFIVILKGAQDFSGS